MNKKVEWYGEIPADIKWLTFADQRNKGYEYNKYFTEITASTDDNGGSITDEIKFNVTKNNTLQKRYAIVNFRQRGGKPATYKVSQKEGTQHNRLPVIDYDTLKLSVTPDGKNIGWNDTSYTFSAVANYENVVYWYVDENDPKDKEHEVSRTPTSYTVTNDSNCLWASKTSGVNVGSNGNFTFESNTSANYKTITVSATYTTKDGHSVSDDGSVIQGLTEEPQYQGDAYISDKSYLEVTPDGGNIGYDVKEYQFTAVLHVKYARRYIIPSQGTEVKVDEDYGKNHGLNTDDDVTDNSYCKWEVVSSKSTDPTNISVEKGLAKFNENLDNSSSRDIYVKATYSKDGLTKSDEGNITQGTGVRTYQLEINPVTLTWGADELRKQEFTVKSTYNNNYRFDYTISDSTNFKYKKLKSEGLIDTYEVWPINNNPSKKPISEDLHIIQVVQNEKKNEKSLTLNQLGVDTTPPFDYMVLRYSWKDTDGTDFDTATHVEGTNIEKLDNQYVGYGLYPSSETLSYLKHGGDNTLSGAECVMINMKEIMDNCGEDIESFNVYVAGNWYNKRGEGNVTCNVTLYSGGTMDGPNSDHLFTNSGGTVVQENLKLSKNVFSKGTGMINIENKVDYVKAFYTTVAKITYYVKAKNASIDVDNNNKGAIINKLGAYPWDAQNIDAGEYKSRDLLQFKVEGEFTEGKEEERTLPIYGTDVKTDIKQYSGSTQSGFKPITDTNWNCKITNVTVINNMISYDITIPENTEKFAKTFDIYFTVKAKLYEGGTEFDKKLMIEYIQKSNT